MAASHSRSPLDERAADHVPAVRFVTGAPGAGKSTLVGELLRRDTGFVVLDIDWLAGAASVLAHRSVYDDPTTWPPYRRVWAAVLDAVLRNGLTPVLFTPADPNELGDYLPDPAYRADWLLLDCADAVRATRLRSRTGWTDQMVSDAVGGAAELRAQVPTRVDTGATSVPEAADAVLAWLRGSAQV